MSADLFDTVLVANRGEIAVRVIRTLRRLGIRAVAVYSTADRDALHVRIADVAVHVGPAPAVDSYLRIDRILDAAHEVGAEAIHPGYGFLSENAAFAQACADAGVVFVGPPAGSIDAMGDKIRAKHTVAAAGVPVVPGVAEPGLTDAELHAAAVDVGFPVLIKPSAGGGGKGMRLVERVDDLADAIVSARREAAGSFGDDTLFVERFVTRPRHIEVQVLLDSHGGAVHLGERECSLQRRHQKIIEEAPSVLLTEARREAMGEQALAAAHACGYTNAGTVEFIVSADQPDQPFFMEMNTRLQVEHPVTEMVWGLDLVEHQIRVAAGEPLGFTQADLRPRGHAIEARLYAEDPSNGFVPSPGRLAALELPADGGGVRVDAGVAEGEVVGTDYDPMIAKVIAWADDRPGALATLAGALSHVHVAGLVTNAGFLGRLIDLPEVAAGDLDTGLVERHLDGLTARPLDTDVAVLAALAVERSRSGGLDARDPWNQVGGWRVGGADWWSWRAEVDGIEVVVRRRGIGDRAEAAVDLLAPSSAAGDPLAIRLREGPEGSIDGVIDGRRRTAQASIDGSSIWITLDGETWHVAEHDPTVDERAGAAAGEGGLTSPMPGTVVVVGVAIGDRVEQGQVVAAVEAMKMEHSLRAPFAGVVTEVYVHQGEQVALGALLVVVEPHDQPAGDASTVPGDQEAR